MSTFSMEMKEAGYILKNATEKSIVIIDELGRGTSNLDGISLAFAISEDLIRERITTLFVTHYTQITSLPNFYPKLAINVHLKTVIGTLSDGIQYAFQVGQGTFIFNNNLYNRYIYPNICLF